MFQFATHAYIYIYIHTDMQIYTYIYIYIYIVCILSFSSHISNTHFHFDCVLSSCMLACTCPVVHMFSLQVRAHACACPRRAAATAAARQGGTWGHGDAYRHGGSSVWNQEKGRASPRARACARRSLRSSLLSLLLTAPTTTTFTTTRFLGFWT